ncbi:MAG: FAD-linked oxidase C-terminal domain-containing protein [Deltaproteobacteria bacterium]
MSEPEGTPSSVRWARLRFSVVSSLLTSPPAHGELQERIAALAARKWTHPSTGEPAVFDFKTIERWYYVVVGMVEYPQSRASDFYRELDDLFGVPLQVHNRWAGFKALRQRWSEHIAQTLMRPVLILDEAQEAQTAVLNEIRILASKELDSHQLLCVVLAGDARLPERFRSPELLPLGSRIRRRLVLEYAAQSELAACLDHLLESAGNPALMTQGLKDTVVEHAAGNYRVLMNLCDELLAAAANLACNAGGPRAFKYGVTRNWVLGLEVVTAEGTVLEVGKPTAKGVTGYDLAGLVVGSEGTLAVVTRATLRLVPKPEEVATLLVFLPSQAALGDAITACLRRHVMPRCLEFLDELALDILRPKAGLAVPASARAMLLVEVDGEAHELPRQIELVGEAMLEAGALDVLLARSEHERASLWAARRDMSHAMRRQARHKLSEDVVVPRTRIGALLDRCSALSEQHGVRVATYGHALVARVGAALLACMSCQSGIARLQ